MGNVTGLLPWPTTSWASAAECLDVGVQDRVPLRTVVSIDRNKDVLHRRAEILQNAGYAVLSARDTETALRLLAIQHSYAAIILGELFSPQVTTWLAEMARKTSVVPLILVYSREDNRAIRAAAHVKAEAPPEAILEAVSAATSRKPGA